jgi:hypothetical protein
MITYKKTQSMLLFSQTNDT